MTIPAWILRSQRVQRSIPCSGRSLYPSGVAVTSDRHSLFVSPKGPRVVEIDPERVAQKVRVQDPLEVASPKVEAEVDELDARQVDREPVELFERQIGRGGAALDARLFNSEDGLVQVLLRRREGAADRKGACPFPE